MAVAITSNYSGEVLDQLLVRATTGNELVAGGHIRVEPNVLYKFSIPRLRAGKMLQKRKEQPVESDAKGAFTIDAKELEPKEFMAFTTFNPRTFERIWRQYQPKGPLVFSELPAEAQNALLSEMAKVVDFELGEHFITGKHGAGATEFFDGVLTRIVADTTVLKIGTPVVLTEENILPKLKAVKMRIPKALRTNPNLKIFMSIEDFDLYDAVITEKPYKGADYSNMNPERYKGIRIVPMASWPKDVIVAAVTSTSVDSNFWAGVAYADDAEVIQIDKLTNAGELYFFKMLLKVDTQIAFGEDIVLYDGRPANP